MADAPDPSTAAWAAPAREVWTVSRLNREVRVLIDSAFGLVQVEGELSNVARPASGHLYFSLKDSTAQVRCAMFRQRNRAVNFTPRSGQQVLVRARVSLYEPRGDFQLIVEHMEPAGEGALRAAFEALKTRLAAEGLFDAGARRPVPALPGRIGIITSPSGAALRDILHVLQRRFPAIPVLIYPVAVQGAGAAAEIASALALASARGDCDVLILARGGGSLEDLWSFNDEQVARAIRACRIPVVSGVGHEIDVTIADFAADLRAPTPSAAAEVVVPDAGEWLRRVDALAQRLIRATRRAVSDRRQHVRALDQRLARQHPGQRMTVATQRLDELEQRLALAWNNAAAARRAALAASSAELARLSPAAAIARRQDAVAALSTRSEVAVQRRLAGLVSRLTVARRTLAAVDPRATLNRGYAIVSVRPAAADTPARILLDAAEVGAGDRIEARLARGRLLATVDPDQPPAPEPP